METTGLLTQAHWDWCLGQLDHSASQLRDLQHHPECWLQPPETILLLFFSGRQHGIWETCEVSAACLY